MERKTEKEDRATGGKTSGILQVKMLDRSSGTQTLNKKLMNGFAEPSHN